MKGVMINMKIVRQRDLKDCGICSLLSIIRYYGGNVSLEQMRLDAKVSSSGTTALNLILASKKYGFDAVGVHMDKLNNDIHLPAIAHLNLKNSFGHYVVIYKITKKSVILMDPAKGKVVKKITDFYLEYSKVLILLYPKRKIIVLKEKDTLLNTFIKVLISEKKLFVKILLLSLFLLISTIFGGYYFQIMIDSINNNYYLEYLKIIVFVFGVFLIAKIILSYVRSYLENFLNKDIDVVLNSNFLNHLFRLPLECITSRNSGEIISRVRELANLKNIFTEIFIDSTLDMLLFLISMPLLFNISNKLFFISFLFLLLYLIIGIITSKIVYKKAYQNIECEENFNNSLLENIKMINSISNLNVTSLRLKNLELRLATYLKDTFNLSAILNKSNCFKNAINEISFFIINTWGFFLVFHENFSITRLITFNTLLGFFINPLRNVIDNLPKYNFLKASYAKINDFLSITKENLGTSRDLLGNSIEISNLKYSYNKLENILINYNLYITANSFVSLDGPSGTGKSTICKILLKYITDYEGCIKIGGENLKDINIATIRSNITYVSQEEHIFTGSIKENILINRDIDLEDFYRICNVCEIEEIVSKRPFRYETTISDYAENISGGEKQRIILARALLKKTKIIILDEALSEVDQTLEKKIINNIKNEFKDRTIIYITHKKYPKLFDKIIKIGGINELSRTS